MKSMKVDGVLTTREAAITQAASVKELVQAVELMKGAGLEPSFLVDVGANVGLYSIYAVKKLGFQHAFAVEPTQDAMNQLIYYARANDVADKITALQIGVGPTNQAREFSRCQEAKGQTSMLYREGELFHGVGRAWCVKLPQLLAMLNVPRLPEFSGRWLLKVDIEGAESHIQDDIAWAVLENPTGRHGPMSLHLEIHEDVRGIFFDDDYEQIDPGTFLKDAFSQEIRTKTSIIGVP